MESEPLQYEKWVEEALRSVIRRGLILAATEGLPGDHHFFITFNIGDAGVDIPGHLKAQHPEEMTIVLQHQFTDLVVDEDGFAVTLVFGGKPSRMIVPFAAVTAFADPAVNFGLQLKMPDDDTNVGTESAFALNGKPQPVDDASTVDEPDRVEDEKMGEVIALDAFRKD
ncbi:MAG: SspB family protein [Alphaproteobacteria bacterium]